VSASLNRVCQTAQSVLIALAFLPALPALAQGAPAPAPAPAPDADIDESAQADCVGRATYVPRIGSQTPITAPRAWRFDLKLDDRGWTIASARSS